MGPQELEARVWEKMSAWVATLPPNAYDRSLSYGDWLHEFENHLIYAEAYAGDVAGPFDLQPDERDVLQTMRADYPSHADLIWEQHFKHIAS